MRKRNWCTIFKLYTNSFCQQRARLGVLMKMASRVIDKKMSGLGQ